MEWETIYTKKYDLMDFEEDECEEEIPLEHTAEEFIEGIQNMKYEPIPGAEEYCQKYIRLAKEMSEAYQIDIDILRSIDSIRIIFHMLEVTIGGDLKKFIAELMVGCNEFNIWPSKNEGEYEIDLTYYTQNAYLFGKKLMRD